MKNKQTQSTKIITSLQSSRLIVIPWGNVALSPFFLAQCIILLLQQAMVETFPKRAVISPTSAATTEHNWTS